MQPFNTLKYIFNHPLTRSHRIRAVKRYLSWQISQLINPYPIIYPFIDHSKLIVKKGMTGATGNIYVGLDEFSDMSFLLHLLNNKDLFIDIGSNIGSYTILASSVRGAKTISIEPVPSTYEYLLMNIYINKISDLVSSYNIAIGSQEGIVNFSTQFDCTNHVVEKNEILNGVTEVTVKRIDDLLKEKNPTLLKIDVEGYETEVIAGAQETFCQESLKAIIIELNGSGQRYGYDEKQIHNKLVKMKFNPYLYSPFRRELKRIESFGNHNTIYIRDIDFVKERIMSSPVISIFGQRY